MPNNDDDDDEYGLSYEWVEVITSGTVQLNYSDASDAIG